MENIFEHFTVSILKLNKLVQKIKNYEMQEYGLKTIHVMCGYYLKNHERGLTAAELSKLTLEDKAAISRALKTLYEKGFVSYDPNKYNSVIRLTDAGKEFADAVCEKATRAVEAGSYNFSEEERLAFYKALGTIADNLTEYYDGLVGSEKAE
ncbi:MAG: MarR family winged helix-turn-helix transcriptional regulator [Clostridia bacterium]|nr:MarR family winged helix-turn-helix transcriptional regulator [Clostridia bacterium]